MGRMNQSPYESPAEAESLTPQRFPWQRVLAGGVITSILGYLAIVAFILINEPPPGVRETPKTIGMLVVAFLIAGVMLIGVMAAIIGGIGWLLSWLRP